MAASSVKDSVLIKKALTILERETKLYGSFDLNKHRQRDSLEQLIKTILSQRTTFADERKAFERMWSQYGSWEAIQNADEVKLTNCLTASRYPEVKAKHIKQTLEQIHSERGMYSIDFLQDVPTEDALEWLMSLPGVGFKTASLVLLFQFQKPVMPVDTHVHRVSKRTGLISPKTTANKAHIVLLGILPRDPETLYNFHRATLTHGQRICHYRAPKCPICPLSDICDAYQGLNNAIRNP